MFHRHRYVSSNNHVSTVRPTLFKKQRAPVATANRCPTIGKELRSLFAYVRYESESRSNLEPFYLQCTRDIDVVRRQLDNVYNYTAVSKHFRNCSLRIEPS